MNRIEQRLAQCKEKGEKAFVTYMTAGLPSIEGTIEIIKAQEEAGIDVIELGIPFSDPTADGPVIQAASYESICRGTNLRKVFGLIKEVRKTCQVPIAFMMYFNTIAHYGVEKFVETCIEVGVDGLIVPDLPMEEQEVMEEALKKENAPFLMQLVAPVSGDRIPVILENAKGFVYCVSTMGVTGQGGSFHKNVRSYLKEVKKVSPVPVMMGFGIRTAKDVEMVKDTIDGCIVGSHFINLMKEYNYDLEVIKDYIRTFKKELNGQDESSKNKCNANS